MMDQKMVEEIVSLIVEKLRESDEVAKPSLYVIAAGEQLSKQQKQMLEQSWRVVEWDPENHRDLPENVENVVFVGADQDLLVKSAVGITDTPLSRIFSETMIHGADVSFIVNDSLNFLLSEDTSHRINPSYRSHLQQYTNTLQKFGVSFVTAKELIKEKSASSSYPTQDLDDAHFNNLVTQKTLKNLHQNYLSVRPGTIITPLAKDTAKELNITIKQTEREGT